MLTRLRHATLPPWVMVSVIAAGVFVTALDQTVVVTALPAVMADLKVPIFRLEAVIWVVTAYLLAYTVAMPLLGRLADVYGYQRWYLASLAVFVAGTILVALSGEWGWLNNLIEPLDQIVVARVVQAIGGGGTVPISLAIAAALVSAGKRGLALGIVAGAAEAGSMLGPAYGGAVIELWGWRAIFWLNVPQAVVIAVALLFLRNQRFQGSRMDYRGAAAFTVGLVLLSLAFAHAGLFRLSSWVPYWLLAGFFLSAGVLGWLQRRTPQPLLANALFQAWAFVAANVCQLLVGIALIIAMATMVIMANTVMNVPGRPVDSFTAALWLLRMTATIPVFSVAGGLLLRWLDARWVAMPGLVLIAIGMFRLAGWQIDIAEPRLTLDMVIPGIGFGLVVAPLLHRAIAASPLEYRGVSASMIVVARMLGMTLGMAALSAWGVNEMLAILTDTPSPLTMPALDAAARAQRLVEYRATLQTASLSLFHNFFRAAGLVSLVALIPAFLMRPSPIERARLSARIPEPVAREQP